MLATVQKRSQRFAKGSQWLSRGKVTNCDSQRFTRVRKGTQMFARVHQGPLKVKVDKGSQWLTMSLCRSARVNFAVRNGSHGCESTVAVPLQQCWYCMRQAKTPAPYSGNRQYSAHCRTGLSHMCQAISQALSIEHY